MIPVKNENILKILTNHFIITKTDPLGRITYANDYFCEISEYTREELIGKPHNIIRHPDMPKSVFKELWQTIKEKKESWTGFIKNRKKNGGYYWVVATVFPVLNEKGEVIEYISLRKDITEVVRDIEEDRLNSILYRIIESSMYTKDLKDILMNALLEILKHPLFELQSMGGIMIWDEERKKLNLTVHYNVSESLVRMCEWVEEGRCLCGRAALKKEIIFKSHVDEEHENVPEGMKPHGHYNVPLIFNDELQGVLFLYVPDGDIKRELVVDYLKNIGGVLGGIIYRFKIEENIKKLNQELAQNNQKLMEMMERNTQITILISQYIPRSTIEFVSENIESRERQIGYKKKKEYAFLFFDLVAFTSFSEINEPEVVVDTINELFVPIIEIIYKNDGDVDKFIGDAIFAFFDGEESALNSAIEIRDLMNDRSINKLGFQYRMGIHRGEAVHGNVGNESRREFTLIGDAVNTTNRLQSSAKENGILVSEEFINRLKDKENYEFSKRYLLKAKGKKEYISVRYLIDKIKAL